MDFGLKNKYDLIFCGGGLSTLIFLNKIISDNYFDDKSILVIEKDPNLIPKKTWSFWEKKDSYWNDFIIKSWDKIVFKTQNVSIERNLTNMNYKMIKSESFYNHIYDKVKRQPNIIIKKGVVENIEEHNDFVVVKTINETFKAGKVLNSIPDNSYKTNLNFPVLLQHFVGWTIQTKENLFDADIATLMDFSIDQNNQTRFFYILPISKNEALVEFTLFSKNLLDDKEYKTEINNYLESSEIKDFKIKSKERGVIPMTCFPFDNANTKNLVNIGTAGGWTKPSSGYTFRFIDKYSDKLIDFIKSEKSFKKFKLRDRFWFYDLLFIDVLYYQNHLGSSLFENMFKKNKFKSIFRFLDNESSLIEELKVIYSFPKWVFIKSFFKNIPKIISAYL